ncbi:MAG TPA: leucine-rich repeat domain-containing protein [Fluviicola sp.]|nr:leucine-rich repeat domain-containing protein [Fluviicola sp.]
MKNLHALIFLLCSISGFSQDKLIIYTWDQVQHANPDTIFAIDASKLKWKECPEKLASFKQLKYLNLSKNKLTSLPEYIGEMTQLKSIDVHKNQLESMALLCKLTALQRIHVAQNKISTFPACMGYLSEIKVLDIWDNPINQLPEEITQLKKLEAVDMRGIMLGPLFQRKWQEAMPQVKWYFDPPCHCEE